MPSDKTTGASASRAGAADRSLSGSRASVAAPAVVDSPTISAVSSAAGAAPAGVAGDFAAGRFAAGFLAADLAVAGLGVADLAVADFAVAGFAVADFAAADEAAVDFAVPAGFFAAGVRGVEDVDPALFARGVRGARGFGAGGADSSVFSTASPVFAAAALPGARRGARGVVDRGVVVRDAEVRGARGVRGFAGVDAAGSTLSEPASGEEDDGSGDSGSEAVIAPNYQRPPTVPASESRGAVIHRDHESTTTGANHAIFQGLLATVDRTRRRDIPVNRT